MVRRIHFSLHYNLVSSQATHSCDPQVSLTAHCEILWIAEPEVRPECDYSNLVRVIWNVACKAQVHCL